MRALWQNSVSSLLVNPLRKGISSNTRRLIRVQPKPAPSASMTPVLPLTSFKCNGPIFSSLAGGWGRWAAAQDTRRLGGRLVRRFAFVGR